MGHVMIQCSVMHGDVCLTKWTSVFKGKEKCRESCLLWPKITNAVIKIVFYAKFNDFFAIRCEYLIFLH